MCPPRNFSPFLIGVSRQRLRFVKTSRMPTVIWVGRRSATSIVVRMGSRTIFPLLKQMARATIPAEAGRKSKPPGAARRRAVFGRRFRKGSIGKRIGPDLDMHGHRRHAFAALLEPRRAVALGAPQAP